MKRTLLTLLIGLACGVVAHVAWFSHRRPQAADGLGAQLAWMQANLHLTDAQVARLQTLHQQSAPHFLELAAQVASMKTELAAFERTRETTGQIDFLEFARFVEQRRALDRACLDSTRALVAASADVMTAPQRRDYLSLMAPALQSGRNASIP